METLIALIKEIADEKGISFSDACKEAVREINQYQASNTKKVETGTSSASSLNCVSARNVSGNGC